MMNKNNAANAILPAIKAAHETGNKRAINKKDAEAAGVSEFQLQFWCDRVNTLRAVVAEYVIAKMDKDADEKEVTKLRNKIFPAWRKILKTGEEDVFHPNLKATSFDVDSLVGFGETFFGTQKGTVWSVQSLTLFRKCVEAYLGCKIAQNAVLNDEERDLLQSYQSAVKGIQTATERLEGRKQGDKIIPGIKQELEAIEGKISSRKKKIMEISKVLKSIPEGQIDTVKFLTHENNMVEDGIKELNLQKATLLNQKNQAEKRIKECQTVIDTTKDAYEAVMAKIEEIK